MQSGTRRTRLDPDEIVCVHADAHYTKVCTRAEDFFCNLSISDVENMLQPFNFLRAHRSHLVNIRHIMAFNQKKGHGEVVVMAAGSEHQIPVSRSKLELLKILLNDAGFAFAPY